MSDPIDLAFLVPLAHPRHVRKPTLRAKLLLRTVHSMQRQTHGAIAVYVVSNEPIPTVADSRVINLVVPNFGPASAGPRPSWSELWKDKGCKLFLAACRAKADGARVVMAVDSDDLVSRRLGAFASDHIAPGSAWCSEQGYIHLNGSRWAVWVRERFHLQNGSSQLLSIEGLPLQDPLDLTADAKTILDGAGERNVIDLFGAHRRTARFVSDRGMTVHQLPFPATVWEVGTGSNYTQVLHAHGSRVAVADLRDEFGMRVPSVRRHLWSQSRARLVRLSKKLKRPD